MSRRKIPQISALKSKPLDSIDEAIIKLLVEDPTLTDTKIAQELDLNRDTINARRKNKEFQKKYNSYLEPVTSLISKAQKKAFAVLWEALQFTGVDKNGKEIPVTPLRIRMDAAEIFLDPILKQMSSALPDNILIAEQRTLILKLLKVEEK